MIEKLKTRKSQRRSQFEHSAGRLLGEEHLKPIEITYICHFERIKLGIKNQTQIKAKLRT